MTSSALRSFAVGTLLAATVSVSLAAAQDAAPVAPVAEPAPAVAAEPVAPPPAPAADAAAPEVAAAPAAATDGLIGAPSAGKGQVVFFRPPAFVGMAISFKVREGETALGTLGNARYFVAPADPGVHIYTVHSEAKDNLRLEVEAGETYYVTSGISVGVVVGRPNISPSDKTSFDTVAKKLKPGKTS